MKKISFKNKKCESIVGILNEPDKKKSSITILLHGYSSNKDGGAKSVFKAINKIRKNTLRIDLDDQGESEPKFEEATITSYVKTTESALEYCKKLGYKKINLLGTSTGGLVAMATVLKHPELNSLILRSPTSSNDIDCEAMFGKKGLTKGKKEGYLVYTKKSGALLKIKYRFYTDGHKYTMFSKVKKIKIPTLIIQGTLDKEVNPKDTKKLSLGFPNAKLIMIKGAGHNLGIDGDYSLSQNAVVKWIKAMQERKK